MGVGVNMWLTLVVHLKKMGDPTMASDYPFFGILKVF